MGAVGAQEAKSSGSHTEAVSTRMEDEAEEGTAEWREAEGKGKGGQDPTPAEAVKQSKRKEKTASRKSQAEKDSKQKPVAVPEDETKRRWYCVECKTPPGKGDREANGAVRDVRT